MSRLKQNSYWQAVRKAYASLGGKFVRQAIGDQASHVPADKNRWAIARELGFNGNRTCVRCNATQVVEPGSVTKHCGTLMAADLTQAERSEIENSLGKVKVSFKAKDSMPGGEADKSEKSEFDKKDLEKGKKHEKEHTSDPDKAEEIASDHIKEDKKYYSKLEKVEKKDASADFTAHFISDEDNIADSHWVVKKAGSPVLKVTLRQAFPGKEKTKAPIFAQKKYGDELLSSVKARGVEGTVKTALKNGATVFGQMNQAAPNALMPAPESVEDTEMQGQPPTDPQADPGLVDPEVGDEILDDKQDRTDIIELVKAALVPFIASAGEEITVQSVVAELKALCQNDQSLNDFQGSLDEQVEQFQQDNSVGEEEKKEEDRGNQNEELPADAGGGMPPSDQQPREASKARNQREAELADRAASLQNALIEQEAASAKLANELREVQHGKVEAERRYAQQLEDNKILLLERTMKARHPRCASLAQQMVDIGEVSAEELGSKIIALLKMPTDDFFALENRVKKVHGKVVVAGRNGPAFNTNGLMTIIGDHRDEGNKEPSLADGPRKGANHGVNAGVAGAVNWS
jgi:hypothetical protein